MTVKRKPKVKGSGRGRPLYTCATGRWIFSREPLGRDRHLSGSGKLSATALVVVGWAGSSSARGERLGQGILTTPLYGPRGECLAASVLLLAVLGSFDSICLALCARHIPLRMTEFVWWHESPLRAFLASVLSIPSQRSFIASAADSICAPYFSARSSHCGFFDSIKAIFFDLLQPFNCFSRAMAF